MAISTYKVFLMHKASSEETYKKLIDIKEFPDLGGEPEMLETTTLSDSMQTYIAGIQSMDGLSFSANTCVRFCVANKFTKNFQGEGFACAGGPANV